METVTDSIFLGSKITADGGCGHEIKRLLLLGRKAMIKLDSVFKSRDITLPIKIHIVKGTVFLVVVMYGCENWTIKKAEHQRIDAFEPRGWRRLFRVPWTSRRSNQSILKEINTEYSLEGVTLKLKLQYSGYLIRRADSIEKTLMLEGFPGGSDVKESTCSTRDLGLIPGLGRSPEGGPGNTLQYSCLENPHGQRSLVGYSPWGRKESDTTEWLSAAQHSADAGKDWRQEEKGTTEDGVAGWHHRLNGHAFEQSLGDGERRGRLTCCSP